MRKVACSLLLLLLAGCASSGSGLSAEEHRARAAEEREKAAQHEARYDESARAMRLSTVAGTVSVAPEDYNPTHFEHDAAEAHNAAAQRHLDAARALETSEDAACVGIAPAARSACPLLSPVVVEDIARGVRVTFKAEPAAAQAAAVIRCQQAFAVSRGFNDLPSCALYGRGLKVTQAGATLELTAQDGAGVDRLRANVRGHHAG